MTKRIDRRGWKPRKKLDGTRAKSNAGRLPVVTPEVIGKLEEVFALDGTVEEACMFADISVDAFYDYCKLHPELSERIKKLRQTPFLKARRTIVGALDQPSTAFEYMKRKKRGEFGDGIDLTTGGDKISVGVVVLPKRDARTKDTLGTPS